MGYKGTPVLFQKVRNVDRDIIEDPVFSKNPETHLSGRDVDILQMCADGYYISEIADKWHVAEQQIKRAKTRIFKVLGAENTYNAIAIALRRGLID